MVLIQPCAVAQPERGAKVKRAFWPVASVGSCGSLKISADWMGVHGRRSCTEAWDAFARHVVLGRPFSCRAGDGHFGGGIGCVGALRYKCLSLRAAERRDYGAFFAMLSRDADK